MSVGVGDDGAGLAVEAGDVMKPRGPADPATWVTRSKSMRIATTHNSVTARTKDLRICTLPQGMGCARQGSMDARRTGALLVEGGQREKAENPPLQAERAAVECRERLRVRTRVGRDVRFRLKPIRG